MEFSTNFSSRAMPFLAIIFLQFGYAGMSILSKYALNKGMSPHVFAVYRHAIATILLAPFAIFFDRKKRPKMTLSIFTKIALLGLLEPVIDQNLYYTGMKYTTAAFASTMCNILPAFTFLMAWCLRLEKVNLRRLESQAKILGTLVAIGGAMVMTLVKGTALVLPWTSGHTKHSAVSSAVQNPIKGALMIISGCFCWSAFIILQTVTLRAYPTELSLAVLICLTGAIEGSVVAIAMEWKNPSAWSIELDSKLLAAVYSGVICSGIGYYLQGVLIRSKGPVFVSAFNPLSMVIVTILGSFFLAEAMYLGRILGAALIVFGLYLVLWGKRHDQSPATSAQAEEGKISNLSASGDGTYQTSGIQITQVQPALQNV